MLSRRLKASQWLALCLLCLGGVLVSDLHGGKAKPSAGPARSNSSFAVGLASVLVAALLSSSSSVYFEMMLKKRPTSCAAQAASLWLRNIQLGIFALPLAACAMLINDGEPRLGLTWLALAWLGLA
jgi:UDP-sugar transporter A1/2/3